VYVRTGRCVHVLKPGTDVWPGPHNSRRGLADSRSIMISRTLWPWRRLGVLIRNKMREAYELAGRDGNTRACASLASSFLTHVPLARPTMQWACMAWMLILLDWDHRRISISISPLCTLSGWGLRISLNRLEAAPSRKPRGARRPTPCLYKGT